MIEYFKSQKFNCVLNRELTSKEIAFYNHYMMKTKFIHGTNSSLNVNYMSFIVRLRLNLMKN